MVEIIDLEQRRELVAFIRELAQQIVSEVIDAELPLDVAMRRAMAAFIAEKLVERFSENAAWKRPAELASRVRRGKRKQAVKRGWF